jgi:DNA-binding response OmpR family regulator
MDVTHPSTATVTVISSAGGGRALAGAIQDAATTVMRCEPTALGTFNIEDRERPDVFVLDRRIVSEIGREIRRLRRRWPTLPVVVVNARDDADVEALLDAGADDAIAAESVLLRARLQAMTRRARTANAGARIAIGDVVFDREAHRVWCNGAEVLMTPRECAVVDCLFWHAPGAVDVDTLANFVWGDAAVARRRNVIDVYIGYVRRKLGASRVVELRTIRGVGYRLVARG